MLWGWNADRNSVYGGAVYKSNGIGDWSTEKFIEECTDVSEDFSNILPGELLWIKGHVGIYFGDGMAVESTTAWEDKVQKVECWNVKKTGRGREWTKHGKLPTVEYEVKKTYQIVIGDFDDKADAEKIQSALKVLGTESNIKENIN